MFPNYGFGFAPQPTEFVETYKCFSMSMCSKEDKEGGDKIFLPMSAFEKLARMHITYPMQFELKNENMMHILEDDSTKQYRTHVGVLEFTAPEGQCFVPYWIMQNLLLEEGSFVNVKNVTLPLAQYIKFRPQTEDFLEISNPKAVLESTLRNFSCVTLNDTLCLPYDGRKYYIDVVDVKPSDACSIVEADVKVDFEAPPGYQKKLDEAKAAAATSTESQSIASSSSAAIPIASASDAPKAPESDAGAGKEAAKAFSLAELAKAREARKKQLDAQNSSYVAFSGQGRRIDGKTKKEVSNPSQKEAFEGVATTVVSARKGKWKSKTQGTAFQGQGNTLS